MAQSRSAARSVFWQEVIQEFEQSDLSSTEFCKLKDLSLQTFYQWRRKLRPAPSTPLEPKQTLVPVRIVSEASADRTYAIQVLTTTGVSLRVDSAMPPSQIAQLIVAIDSASRGPS